MVLENNKAPEIAAALRSISTGHALSNDLCMDVGWRRVCSLGADLIEQLAAEPPNAPLTLEELRGRTKPVWCDIPDCSWIPDGGYYCLCEKGAITPPSKQTFQAEECLKNGWILLDRKPDGGVE